MKPKTKTVKPKLFQSGALFKSLEQKQFGKNKKNPFTRFVIDMPLIDGETFTELCVNNGYNISVKVQYIPCKIKKEKKDE